MCFACDAEVHTEDRSIKVPLQPIKAIPQTASVVQYGINKDCCHCCLSLTHVTNSEI